MIRGRQKYIYAAGDTLWMAVVVIYEGSDTLRKRQRAQGKTGPQQRFQRKIKGDHDGCGWSNKNPMLICEYDILFLGIFSPYPHLSGCVELKRFVPAACNVWIASVIQSRV